jgi:hypothetical protein
MSSVRVVTHQSCQSKVGYFDQVVFTNKAVASCQIPAINIEFVVSSNLDTSHSKHQVKQQLTDTYL